MTDTKAGRRPTFGVIMNRKPEMSNWKEKDSKEVIDMLVKRGEIAKDDSKTHTAYYRQKTT